MKILSGLLDKIIVEHTAYDGKTRNVITYQREMDGYPIDLEELGRVVACAKGNDADMIKLFVSGKLSLVIHIKK